MNQPQDSASRKRPDNFVRVVGAGFGVGVTGLAAGGWILSAGAHGGRALVAATSFLVGGAIFFGYSALGCFYFARRR
jgi:hypothetical protein